MVVSVGSEKKGSELTLSIEGNRVVFKAPEYLTIQPDEIVKIPLNVVLAVGEGEQLIITTSQSLVAKQAQVFPGTMVLTPEDGPVKLSISVYNLGRTPLIMNEGFILAIGTLLPLKPLKVETLELQEDKREQPSKSRSKQRPRGNISFKITK